MHYNQKLLIKIHFLLLGESFELFESGTTIENQVYGVNMLEQNLDRAMFLVTQNIIQENEPYKVGDSEESEAMIAEEYLDSEESEFIESEIITNEIARNEFISGLTNDVPETKRSQSKFCYGGISNSSSSHENPRGT